MSLRWATPADIESFYGTRPTQTVRALAWEMDGVVIGMGGLSRDAGQIVAFLDLKPEARTNKRALVRALREGHKKLFVNNMPVIAIADPNEPTARGLLEHFGFEHIENGVFVWHS